MKEENISRGKWPLAGIIDVVIDIVQVVKVKTMAEEHVQPVAMIFPLKWYNNFEVPQGGGVRKVTLSHQLMEFKVWRVSNLYEKYKPID